MTGIAKHHKRRVRRAAHAVPLGVLHRLNSWRHAAGRFLRRPWVFRSLLGSSGLLALVLLAALGLWWRLNNGPIEVDMATPWLKAAMQENFGADHTVSVGGTQIERDEKGRASLRLLDIVVRDKDGTVVASAPKAEVGISGAGLFSGHIVAQSLNLVGAENAAPEAMLPAQLVRGWSAVLE